MSRGGSDLFIKDGELLKIKLCHEADIHITTGKASIEDPKPRRTEGVNKIV